MPKIDESEKKFLLLFYEKEEKLKIGKTESMGMSDPGPQSNIGRWPVFGVRFADGSTETISPPTGIILFQTSLEELKRLVEEAEKLSQKQP